MSSVPTYFELIAREQLAGFDRLERRAQQSADRINRMKAELTVTTGGGGGLQGGNPFTTEGLGKIAGSVAVVAALDRGLHALAGGMKEYNEAVAKGEDGTKAFVDGLIKSLPILREAAALGEELGKAYDRAHTLQEQIKPGARFGKDIDAEEAKRQAALQAGDAADKVASGADEQLRLVGKVGFDHDREELEIRRQRDAERIAELRQKAGGDSIAGVSVDAAEEQLKKLRGGEEEDIAKREAERLGDILDNFFGEVEDYAAKQQERIENALDKFFDKVEEPLEEKAVDAKAERRRESAVVENRAFTDVTRGIGGDGLDKTNQILKGDVAAPLKVIAREILIARPAVTS